MCVFYHMTSSVIGCMPVGDIQINKQTNKDTPAPPQSPTAGVGLPPALWAHPPVSGRTTIEYYVPVPQQVHDLTLKTAIGIRDGAKIAKTNLVAFNIKVNGLRVWGAQTNQQTWQPVEVPIRVTTGDMVRFTFTTEALGSHQWTWAVWGNPELIGGVVTA